MKTKLEVKMGIHLDAAKKQFGIKDYSAYQMTVLMRKASKDEFKHKELLAYIVSTGYEAKHLKASKTAIKRMKSNLSKSCIGLI